MTTDTMKLALMYFFRWKLQYPLVATECQVGHYLGVGEHYADILAIRKAMAVEVEIKRHRYEIVQDLKSKMRKHQFYLQGPDSKYTLRPNKFYFALPANKKNQHKHKAEYVSEIPDPYGLIYVYSLYECCTIKQAKFLTREDKYVGILRQKIEKRLTSENIDLRLKIRGMKRK